MFKKLLIAGAFALAFAASSQAQATNYYIASVCAGTPHQCPAGPNPVIFYAGTTIEQCEATWAVLATGVWNLFPRMLTDCYPG